MKIILETILENISTRSDGSVKIVLGSQEIGTDDAGRLFQLRNKFIKTLLSDTNISEMEEKLIDEQKLQNGKKVKTKSQRLRAVLFRLHEQSGGVKEDFDTFYNDRMELIIEQIKNRLTD